MSTDDSQAASDRSQHRPFGTTHWSVVVAAGHKSSPQSREALATLCENYWYPIYAYVRRRGYQPAEAQDLTQGFFAQLLEKGSLQFADQSRGKFRSFLLGSLNHYLANQLREASALKRGGRQPPITLDVSDGERRYHLEPADDVTPERIYERRWAMTLLDKSVSALRREYEQSNRLHVFEILKVYLGGHPHTVPYRDIAEQLESSEGAVKVAVHRMRRRCRELLRREIAETVSTNEQVNDELRHLFKAVEGSR